MSFKLILRHELKSIQYNMLAIFTQPLQMLVLFSIFLISYGANASPHNLLWPIFIISILSINDAYMQSDIDNGRIRQYIFSNIDVCDIILAKMIVFIITTGLLSTATIACIMYASDLPNAASAVINIVCVLPVISIINILTTIIVYKDEQCKVMSLIIMLPLVAPILLLLNINKLILIVAYCLIITPILVFLSSRALVKIIQN